MNRAHVLAGATWLLTTAGLAQAGDSLLVSTLRSTPDSGRTWPIGSARHVLRLETTAMYDATAIRNDLLLQLWQGGTISRDTRQRSAGSSSATERAGYLLEATLSYTWGDSLFGCGRFRPRIAVGYHDVLGLRYTDDLYQVTFFGNGAFENDVAELAPSGYEKVRYQTFGIGAQDRRSGSYVMVQLVNGQDLSSARIRRADLFTATDGQYLRMDLDGDHARSADDGSTGWRSRGIGAALGARLNGRLHLWKKVFAYGLGVDDLGAVLWNDQSLRVERDTTILFEGIRVDDVFNLDGVFIDRNSLQDTLGLGYSANSFWRPLPARLYGSIALHGSCAMRYAMEVDVRNLPGYAAHAVLSATHGTRNGMVRAQVSIGGFGGWRAGIGAGRTFGGNFALELLAPNVVGLVSERSRGQGIMLSATCAW